PVRLMGGLPGVFLEVRPLNADDDRTALAVDHDLPVDAERLVVLRDLVALREVGIEVVLPVPLRERGDLAGKAKSAADRLVERAPRQDGHRAGQSETRRADE